MASITVHTPLGNVVIGSLLSMIRKPIGVWSKNWWNIQASITRNVGGLYGYTSDSWGTPIGELSDPDYTEKVGNTRFFLDPVRSKYANYIEYTKNTYGTDLSVASINNGVPFRDVIDFKREVGVIGSSYGNVDETLKNILDKNQKTLSPNIQRGSTDTILGSTSLNILSNQLTPSVTAYKNRSYLNRSFSMFGQSIYGENVPGFVKTSYDIFEYDSGRAILRQNYKFDRSTVNNRSDGNATTYVYRQLNNSGITNYSVRETSKYSLFSTIDGGNKHDLIDKTDKLFRNGNIKSLVAKFATGDFDKDDIGASAFSNYGYSRGRNLLRAGGPVNENGYNNPFCRVWTFHHQYHRLADAIRPFSNGAEGVGPGDLDNVNGWTAFRSPNVGMEGGTGGGRLQKFGVINYKNNGLVNITPVDDGNPSHKVDIRSCMFSIENLAWKGVFNMSVGGGNTSQNAGLSNEQKGPFGGRIMWFPPYDIKIDESVNANWNRTDFIGRGESIFTYSNTSREGHLSFKMLIDHPSIVNYWLKNQNQTNQTDSKGGNVDDVNSAEQTLLRFFAGCDDLRLNNIKKEEKIDKPKANPVVKPKDDTVTITSFLFFPNNYTGFRDTPNKAMLYLMNGMGSGRLFDPSTTDTSQDYDIQMIECYNQSGDIQIGGYEVRGGLPISIIDTPLNPSGNGSIVDAQLGSGNTIHLGAMKGKSYNAWWKAKWAYRVDTDSTFINEVLHSDKHYVDTESFGLNSGGKQDSILSIFSNVKKTDLYAFTDLYVALTGGKSNDVLKKYYSEENVDKLKEILKGKTTNYKISRIECNGWASNQGTSSKNKTLAKRRGMVTLEWLKSVLGNKITNETKIKAGVAGIGNTKKTGDVSVLNQKIYRCCQITIELKLSETKDAVNAVKSTGNTMTKTSNSANTNANSSSGSNTNSKDDKVVKIGKGEREISTVKTNEKLNRYDNEAQFFRLLEINDPVMHHKITDKIKYFDPAFHSVSPEGFNARLTFLQQCMRQGPTVGGSDLYSESTTANNLAFGRPPVCILRIGDFYYTKIIITSLQINYDTPWDLNTEGIGVMPMMADITLNFHFIGGSSLRGPIDRLQNALSFNMYANTEVYDNRSEQVDYDENGKITNYKAFVPK